MARTGAGAGAWRGVLLVLVLLQLFSRASLSAQDQVTVQRDCNIWHWSVDLVAPVTREG